MIPSNKVIRMFHYISWQRDSNLIFFEKGSLTREIILSERQTPKQTKLNKARDFVRKVLEQVRLNFTDEVKLSTYNTNPKIFLVNEKDKNVRIPGPFIP